MKKEQAELKSPTETPAAALVKESEHSHETDEEDTVCHFAYFTQSCPQ